MIIASYLLAGIFAGITAGLFGVGGGLVVVPILIFIFHWQGVDPAVLTHMAIGTSLATIMFTSASSVYKHHQLGGVLWTVFKPMTVGIALGAVAGVMTAVQLEGEQLKKMFGIFAILVSIKMMFQVQPEVKKPLPEWPVLVFAGTIVAWVSSIFGIGGGTLSVPFLSRFRLQMKYVVGTSAACGLPIAVFATLSNVVVGAGVEARPEWSAGFVYLPALLAIVMTSIYFARVGASLAHYLPGALLSKLFSAFLMIVGIKFLI
ncbi:MAG: sulfite exporter TauE/SafE family protein [Oleiphilus sp.]